MEIAERTDELYHHGIKGMKWGIRRYQNKDGSLTKAGQKRYDKEMSKLKDEKRTLRAKQRSAKKLAKLRNLESEVDELKKETEDKETPEEKRTRLLKSTDAKEIYENRDLLTTNELNDRINRIDTEARLKSKIVEEHTKTGMEVLNEKMQKTSYTINNASNMFRSVDQAYTAVSKSAIGKTLAKKLGIEEKRKPVDYEKFLKNIANESDEKVKAMANRIGNEQKIKSAVNGKQNNNNNNSNNSGLTEDDVADIVNKILEDQKNS